MHDIFHYLLVASGSLEFSIENISAETRFSHYNQWHFLHLQSTEVAGIYNFA